MASRSWTSRFRRRSDPDTSDEPKADREVREDAIRARDPRSRTGKEPQKSVDGADDRAAADREQIRRDEPTPSTRGSGDATPTESSDDAGDTLTSGGSGSTTDATLAPDEAVLTESSGAEEPADEPVDEPVETVTEPDGGGTADPVDEPVADDVGEPAEAVDEPVADDVGEPAEAVDEPVADDVGEPAEAEDERAESESESDEFLDNGSDYDGDGYSNYEEYLAGSSMTDPASTPWDRDGDGYSNATEENRGSDADDATSTPWDRDGDGYSNATEEGWGSDADDAASTPGDRDGDGFTNSEENAQGSDPDDAASTPNDPDGDGTLTSGSYNPPVTYTISSNSADSGASGDGSGSTSAPSEDGGGLHAIESDDDNGRQAPAVDPFDDPFEFDLSGVEPLDVARSMPDPVPDSDPKAGDRSAFESASARKPDLSPVERTADERSRRVDPFDDPLEFDVSGVEPLAVADVPLRGKFAVPDEATAPDESSIKFEFATPEEPAVKDGLGFDDPLAPDGQPGVPGLDPLIDEPILDPEPRTDPFELD